MLLVRIWELLVGLLITPAKLFFLLYTPLEVPGGRGSAKASLEDTGVARETTRLRPSKGCEGG